MFRRLLSVGGFTLLSRLTGFGRDVLMATIVGNGFLSDALLVGFLFPNYFRQIFGEGTINPAFLPRYAALHAKGQEAAAAKFADEVFSWQMAAQVVILILAMSAMPFIARAIVPGYTPSELSLTVQLARITFPYLVMTVVAIQLSAMLNAIEKFWAAAAWSNFQNVCMIATLLCWRWFPNAAFAAAWGVVFGGVAQLFFMLWAAGRDGLSLRVSWPRWTPEIAEFFKAYGAVTFGAASVVVAPLLDFFLASYLPVGSRTALYYADRVDQLPLGVLGIALGTVLLPEMSARLAKNDRDGSDAAQNRAAALTLLLTLPFAVAFVAIPGTLVRAVFAHGAFNASAAGLSAAALAAYGVGLPAYALVRIVASTFYARHDTMTPARVTMTAIAVNVALKIVFVWGLSMGVVGIALGTALAAWVNVGTLVWFGRSRGLLRVSGTFWRALLPSVLAAAVVGAAALAVVRFAGPHLPHRLHDVWLLLAAMGGAGVCYVAVVLVFWRALPLGRRA
ncbi:MAG TPA: murein biosynthesis integral membrane protein MurJ [Rhizomicrobium sp.]|jgi:putative peptidoglycan lipid II flippase|nr:murein biosynthesis integral membrane protein MurJ [Rhizomicrobium sp.]